MHTAVIFVDSKGRDLMGAALIAHHLEKLGIACRLEPLEAWRACIGAWKPDLLLFNHLNASHLAAFSQQCREWGVLVGVLPNEGIFYVPGTLEYNSRRVFDGVHCDLMLTWNETHRDVLIANGFCERPEQVVPVGVPRFDFYKEPWSRLFKRQTKAERPVVLANANFQLSHFADQPPEQVDRFFGQWKNELPIYADYWGAIRSHKRSSSKFLEYLEALLAADKYEVVVRPHPRENPNFYREWLEALPPSQRGHIRLAINENITELILNADVEISCENCTTTMEAWIAGKPTVGLTFDKHPFCYTPEIGELLPECDDPARLVAMVDEALAHPEQERFAEGRLRHMERWMYKADGNAAGRVAQEIAKAIANRSVPKNIRLDWGNKRRGVKLRIARFFGEPVHVSPVMFLRRLFRGMRGKQTLRYRDYMKALRPAEERRAREFVRAADAS